MYLTACSSAQSDHYAEIMSEAKTAVEDGQVNNMDELSAYIVERILHYELHGKE